MDNDSGLTAYVRRVLIAVLIVGVALAFGELLVHAVWAFLVLFAGILFGIFLHDVSRGISRRTRLPRSWALGVVVAAVVAAAGGLLYYTGASVVRQVGELRGRLTESVDQIYGRLRETWLGQSLPEEVPSAQDVVSASGVEASSIASNVGWAVSQVGWFAAALAVIFFTGIYLAADSDRYTTGIVKLVPLARRGRAREVLHKLHEALGRWILARIISMAIIGTLTAVGLWALGVPLAPLLGAITALLEFVPNIGPTLALVPQCLVAAQAGSLALVGYVVLLNIAMQGLESYVVTPLVEQHEVSLPPVLTITMQLALGIVFGVMGVVLAAPLEAVAMVLVQMLYIEDALGDPSPGDLVVNQTT